MHPDQDEVDAVNPMAEVMSTMPEVWQRLLENHLPDSTGRCLACRNHGTAGVPWPCTLQVIASDARSVYQASVQPAEPVEPVEPVEPAPGAEPSHAAESALVSDVGRAPRAPRLTESASAADTGRMSAPSSGSAPCDLAC